jgi:hypothetical protein
MTDNRDVLNEKWACLTCSSTFPAGEMFVGRSPFYMCPRCGAEGCVSADGRSRTVPEYFGEIGTKQ